MWRGKGLTGDCPRPAAWANGTNVLAADRHRDSLMALGPVIEEFLA